MTSREREDAITGLLKRSLAGDTGAGKDCPEPDILAAYFERSLGADETARVELHMSQCARCRDEVAALVRSREAPAPAVRRKRAPALWLWDWRWLAPVAVVLLLTVVWATRRSVPTQIAQYSTAVKPNPATPPQTETLAPEMKSSPSRPASRPAGAPQNPAFQPQASAASSESAPVRPSPEGAIAGSSGNPARAAAQPAGQNAPARQGESANEERHAALSDRIDASAALESQSAGVGVPAAGNNNLHGAVGGVIPSEASAKQEGVAVNRASRHFVMTAPGDLSDSFIVPTPAPKVLWLIENAGFVARSIDGGATWRAKLPKQNAHYVAGSAPSPNVCWLVGDDGIILLTADGTTWQVVPPPTQANFVKVTARDAWSATVTAADGRRFTTSDRGGSWTPAE